MTLNSKSHPMATLDDIDVGSSMTLVSLNGARTLRRRLMELGLLPGTQIRLVRRNHVGGFVEVEVRRSRVSLRLSEARNLQVTGVTS